MIASILPTTRHLYRRLHRKARRAIDSRATKSNSGDHKDSNGLGIPGSAELGHIIPNKGSDGGEGRGIKVTKKVDIWQTKTDSSQEELTMGEWYREREGWERSRLEEELSKKSTSEVRSEEGDVIGRAP